MTELARTKSYRCHLEKLQNKFRKSFYTETTFLLVTQRMLLTRIRLKAAIIAISNIYDLWRSYFKPSFYVNCDIYSRVEWSGIIRNFLRCSHIKLKFGAPMQLVDHQAMLHTPSACVCKSIMASIYVFISLGSKEINETINVFLRHHGNTDWLWFYPHQL